MERFMEILGLIGCLSCWCIVLYGDYAFFAMFLGEIML